MAKFMGWDDVIGVNLTRTAQSFLSLVGNCLFFSEFKA